MKKSVLALILAVLMAVGLLTIGAAADGTTLPKPVNGVITLTEDVKLSRAYQVASDIIIDLNGHTLTTVDTGFSSRVLLNVMENGKLTVRDSAGNGAVIVNEHYPKAGYETLKCVEVRADGEFVLESGTIKNTNPELKATQTISNYGTTTIKGGTVEGVTCIFSFAPSVGKVDGWNGKVATVSIVGGEIKGTPCTETTDSKQEYAGASYGVATYGPGVSDDGSVDNTKSIINISGGTITAMQGIGTNASGGKYAGYTLNMTGGTVNGTKDGTGMYLPAIGINNISGGTITGAQGIRICAGELDITGGTIIGTDGFDANTDLVNGGSGGTAGAIVIGKAGASGYVGSIDVDISDSAKIQNSEGAAIVVSDKNMAASAYENYGISVDITGGTITGDVRKVSNLTDSTTTRDGGNTTLTLDDAIVEGDVVNSTKDGDVLIANSEISGAVTNESSSGKMAVIRSEITSFSKNVAVIDSTVNGTPTTSGSVSATVNGKLYDDLQDAIDAVGNGQTITMLKDVDDAKGITVPENRKFTIDFDGHEYVLTGPGAGSTGTETNGFQLLKDSTITMKNGTIKVAENADSIKRLIQNYANLTLEDMTFYAENQVEGEAYALSFNNGNIVFKGNTNIYTTSDDTIAFDVCKYSSYPSTKVTFDETYTGTVNGIILYDSPDPETHTLTINGNGTFGGIELSTSSTYEPAILVTGGRFAQPIDDAYLSDSFNYQAWDGTYYTYHETREEALAAAGANGIVSAVEGEGKVVYNVYYYTGTTGSEYRSESYIANDYATVISAPSKPGYIFMGWKCSDRHTHQPGEVIEVTKNMTFTAIWANMPDITPGTPGGDDDDEPVVTFPFTDVREGQWFYEAVKYVYDEGIMNGMDRYTFDPNGSLTRAMVWTMLARHEGVDTEGGANWYAKAQEWAVEAGVSDGTDPMGNITREQLVTMLWRLNGSETTTGSLTGYTDYDKVSDWAGNAMLWATVNGIIEGDEANALNPTAGCTRAQAAAMIMRFCENVELSPTV